MNRPARAFFLLLALGALSTVSALYLETTIPLGAARGPLWSPIGNKVYFLSMTNGRDYVTVIDGATNQVTRNIRVEDDASSLALNMADGKIYCTSGESDVLEVICAHGDSLIRQLQLTGFPTTMVHDARRGKLFVAAADDEVVYAIDARGDTVVARIPVHNPYGMLIHPQMDRLFISHYCNADSLLVLDCVADTVTAQHHLMRFVSRPLCVGTDGEVFVPCRYQLEVFSSDGEALVATIPTSSRVSRIAIYAPRLGKLYISDPDLGILAIDCRGRTIVDTIPLGVSAEYMRDAVFDTVHNMLYVLCRRQVLAIDTRNDSVVAVVNLPDRSASYALAWNPVNRRIYADDSWLNAVYVLRDTTSGVEESQPRPFSEPAAPTVVRGILRLPQPASGTLLDASGRAVLALKDGANDVSRLAPGVYFVLTPH
ncbi:MAG: YncE family protein, partial [bacterium]